jgi:SAM-dependent methyltransferase
MTDSVSTFSQRSASYATARPRYPEALHAWIAAQCPRRETAWDCATGNGQAATGLAKYFTRVCATDLSEEQIAHAIPHPAVQYACGSAEDSGFGDDAFDLVTVAEALHWFDYARFWPEVSRVLRPGGLFCAFGYAWYTSTPRVDELLTEPLREALEPFWSPRIRILLNGYVDADIHFPYARIAAPELAMTMDWSLRELIAFAETWSAFKLSRQDPGASRAVDAALASVIAEVGAETALTVRIPLSIVAGRKPV